MLLTLLLPLLLPGFSEYHVIILHQRLSPVSPTASSFFFWLIHRYVLAFFSWCLLSPKSIQKNIISPSSIPRMYTRDIARISCIHLAQQRKKSKKSTTILSFLSPRSADVNNYATYLNAAYRALLLHLCLPFFNEYHDLIVFLPLSISISLFTCIGRWQNMLPTKWEENPPKKANMELKQGKC